MKLKDYLLENTEAFIIKIDEFSDAQFNVKPAENSWSPADVTEHLYRSEFGIPKLFTGKTKAVTGRKPDALVSKMKKEFLESDRRMKASGVIVPTEGDKSKTEIIEKFRRNRQKTAELIEELDPDELCLMFEHPVFGYLTRLEWVHFNIIHTQRHVRQIERIKLQLQQNHLPQKANYHDENFG